MSHFLVPTSICATCRSWYFFPKTKNRKQLPNPSMSNSFHSENSKSSSKSISRASNNATCHPSLPAPPTNPWPPPCPHPNKSKPKQFFFLSADCQTMPGGSRSLISPIPPSSFIPLLKNVWKGDTENSKKRRGMGEGRGNIWDVGGRGKEEIKRVNIYERVIAGAYVFFFPMCYKKWLFI